MTNDIKEQIKMGLTNVLTYYGATPTRSNWHCIPSRHKNNKYDLTVKNGLCACHCGIKGDSFSVIAIMENLKLSERNDFLKASQKACEILNINFYLDTSHNLRRDKKMIKNTEKPITQPTLQSERVIDLTQDIISYYNKNNTTDKLYFKSRGLSNKIIDKYKLLVANPKELLKNHIDLLPAFNNITAYEYILPIWENGKVVRFISRRNDKKSTFGKKVLNLSGIEQKIFNIDLLKSSHNLIFVTEAVFDGLAIESISDEYHSICLNSTAMTNRFLTNLEKNIDNCKEKMFILCGDNDKDGVKMNSLIQNRLNQAGIDNSILDISKYEDVNDFVVADPNKFSYILFETAEALKTKRSVFSYLDNNLLNDIKKMQSYKVKSTGFRDLNNKLSGGLHSGLYVLGAISSLGKTTLIHQIADNVADEGDKVLFFSLEQSQMELVSKSISRELFKIDEQNSLTAREIMMGKVNNNLKLALGNYVNASKNIFIHEGNFNTTVKTIRETIEKHVRRHNDNPLVIIDYLQILQALDVRMSDKQKVETNVTELKRISRDYNIPLIVISSLNRDSYLNPISFESFKETGGIEYTADVVFGLQYTNIESISSEKSKIKQRELLKREATEYPRRVELVCLKQRNGQQTFSTGFKFMPHFNTFIEEL